MRKASERVMILLFLAITFSVWSGVGSAAEVTGKVVLQTDGGDRPVPNQPVRMRILKGGEETQWAESVTDARGTYRFRNLDPSPDFLYAPHLTYEGVPYEALPLRFDGGDTLRIPPFRLFRSTGSPDDLEIAETVHLEPGPGETLTVRETLTIRNRGSNVFGRPIEIPLPRGGFDLDFLEGLSRETAELDDERNLLRFRKPILPGRETGETIRFSYSLPYRTRGLSLVFPSPLTRSGFDLFVTNARFSVASGQLERMPIPSSAGRRAFAYSGGPFAAGETVRVKISGLWRAEDVGRLAVLLGWGLVLAAAFWIGFRRRGASA